MLSTFADSALLSGIVGALVGGAVAAAITARVNLRLARDKRRDRASAVLWEYHRALSGFAVRLFEQAGYGDESVYLAQADMAELREAYKAAYPWAGYLRAAAQSALFHDASFVAEMNPCATLSEFRSAAEVQALAAILCTELTRVFPLK